MRALASSVWRISHGRNRALSCRYIAGRRFAAIRKFHTSLPRQRDDDHPSTLPIQVVEAPSGESKVGEDTQDIEGAPEDGSDRPSRPKDKNNYGSAARRAGRNVKRVKELPPVHIPPWLLDRNIVLRDHSPSRIEFTHVGEILASDAHDLETLPTEVSDSAPETNLGQETSPIDQPDKLADGADQAATEKSDFGLHRHTNLLEICSLVRAGLQLPSWQRSEITPSLKPHILLYCPKEGASRFLEKLSFLLARDGGTDFLRLSPQDIAEIGGDYLDEPSNFQSNTISSLGYDAPRLSAARQSPPPEDPAEEEEEDYDGVDEEDMATREIFKPGSFQNVGAGPIRPTVVHMGAFAGSLSDVFKSLSSPGGTSQPNKPVAIRAPQQPVKDMTPELKMGLLVETLLNTPEIKRAATVPEKQAVQEFAESSDSEAQQSGSLANETGEHPSSSQERGSNALIVLVEDYPEIHSTASGNKFIEKLHEVVEQRRKEGQKVLILGTASSTSMMSSMNRSGVNGLQNDPRAGPMRTIVTPVNGETADAIFETENKRKIKAVNVRHLRDMLRRIAPDFWQVARIALDWDLDINSAVTFLSGMDETIWSMDRVGRTATTALGLLGPSQEMTVEYIQDALKIIDASDSGKYEWVQKEKEVKKSSSVNAPGSSRTGDSKERIRKLRKTANDHEKKLLNGVVHPEDIRTTFADVRAPPSTIDALKTLTSLSLVRPDAFTYGVLATDRIPGLLLYGPPGTGKTLLAKAVAKESGATVLEVSGSDVYDMYVGEGEKNIKAIFSLAKKLTPCVVFIDEADAILGARSGGSNRTSHRELINQFLREWDGMTETSAFIMVATNRPFDLDEASLRRLPRRMLIDLPVEKDREEILKIHLKDEVLDPEVSLSSLASQTPFYSGSDLKNVAVAAALTCVREEFDTAATHAKDTTNTEPYKYPEKRTLHTRHFTKAMEEISASISEDMGSLSAIRKFDEKYGDRRGRRKKGGYGFKTVKDNERDSSDAARVRNRI